jgi:dTDP-4-amino-4,6-dideoxygalactose transaminase
MNALVEAETKVRLSRQHAKGRIQRRPYFVGGMHITARQLFGSRACNNHLDWFAGSKAYYVHTARTAIHKALSLLNLRFGDEILVPAYHCGSEVDVMLKAGADVRLFRVSSAAQIDIDDLQKRITDRTKAIYVIHYFGFPQPLAAIAELCRSRGLHLIEDCALSLLTEVEGRRIGSLGDVAVYNLPKTIPVPDGGALVINNPELKGQDWARRGPGISNTIRDLFPLLKQTVLHGLPHAVARFLFAALRPPPEPERATSLSRPEMPDSYYFSRVMGDRKLSRVSAWLMRSMDLAEIRARRRLNYSLLLKQILPIPGHEPLFKDLPAGVCPLSLPIVTQNARELADELRVQSIPAVAWWSGYHSSFPNCGGFEEARFLKDHVVALPIHHQLDAEAVDFIAAKIAALLPAA